MATDPLNNPPKTILVFKLGAMGDFIFASSFMEQLRRNFPDSRILLVTGQTYMKVLQANRDVDQLIAADDKTLYKGSPWAKFKETFRLVALLRKEHIDCAFVLHRAWPFNLLVFLAGIPCRVGFNRRNEGMFLTHKVKPQPRRNEREMFLDLLRVLDIPVQYEGSRFYLSEEEDQFLARYLEQEGIEDSELLIGIGPGGGKNVKSWMPSRRWPQENFIALAKKFSDAQLGKIILFGSRDETELMSAIRNAVPNALDASDLSFGEMASVFRRCQVYIGNDSGPLHIADAMGVPIIGLYGPTDPKVQGAINSSATLLFKDVECSPCFDNGSFPPCDHITCLTSISVEEVWQTLLNKLEQIKPTASTDSVEQAI